jgi:hypothetical protein
VSGYTPLFSSLFQGSLCGKFPDLYVWMVMLGLANRHGEVDCHPSYIASVAGIPADEVGEAIQRLCEPDPHSRSVNDEGRRLIPIPNRGFGWIVVNHGKYREKARKQAQQAEFTASGRDAERKRQQRAMNSPAMSSDVQPRPAMSSRVRPSDTDTDTDTDKSKKPRERGARKASRRVPAEFSPDREFASAHVPDMDVEVEIAKFRDWEFKTARSDWPAVWRTWVRNAKERGQYAKKSTSEEPMMFGGQPVRWIG